MPNKIQYSRELRAKAKERSQDLFAVGTDNKNAGYELHGLTDPDLAGQLFRFCVSILSAGKTPEEAFAEHFEGGE